MKHVISTQWSTNVNSITLPPRLCYVGPSLGEHNSPLILGFHIYGELDELMNFVAM